MAAKSRQSDEPRRLNRVVGVAEALSKTLDPALRKRGFASRDIITHWAAMAPAPYDKVALPDRLVWPRGERGAEGATLYLRCVPGHALALSHEGQLIAAAINRYFGYVLVGAVRLSAEPFTPHSGNPAKAPPEATAAVRTAVEQKVDAVADEGVKEALRRLGHAIIGNAKR
ncbi:MAG: DciA family protein [Devosia sp.]|nr:DciA family protein [Devosia sp.]